MKLDLQFLCVTSSWRFWAFGWHRNNWFGSDGSRWPLFVIGFGPWRFQFIDHSRRWRPRETGETP